MKLKDLTPDTRNANKGTPRGQQMIEDSLRNYGAGRSILVDKNLRIIAGNKTAENAGSIGMDDVIIVQTDGRKLVAVQRMDLDLETDKAAKELAVADNRSGQVSLEWDGGVLQDLDIDLSKFWTEDELKAVFAELVPAELLTDEDAVPEVPEEPKTRLGDLYILGNHRLLCGDSTVSTDVDRLLTGDRKQSTLWKIDKPMKSETGHSTQKPAECMRRPIQNNSSPGQAIYDPFLGSGTTMIACETEGRACFGMELNPAYCDVIVTRWENATGKKAVLYGA
jgi:hypothetical protein